MIAGILSVSRLSLSARLCLHQIVHATKGLMVSVGAAHPRIEQVIRKPREPAAHLRIEGA